MSAQRPGILVICHASAAELAAKAGRRLRCQDGGGGGRAGAEDRDLVDVLAYGRASAGLPPPAGTRLVAPAIDETQSPVATLRLLAALRHANYEFVALSQPALAYSRVRGLLIAFAYLVAPNRAAILDPASERVVGRITFRLAVAELSRWLALRSLARAVVAVATSPLEWLASKPSVRREIGDGRSVVYLRTDIDLTLAPLRAGGSVAHTTGILRGLLDRGYDVSYWGTGEVDGMPPQLPRRRLPAILKGNLATEIAEFVSGGVQGLVGDRPRAGSADTKPNAFVYQRYSLNNFAGVLLARRWGVPLILEANGSEAKWREDFGSLSYPKLSYACERLILRRADIVATVSANAAADLLACGAPPERLRVVPNGVSVRGFATAAPMPLPGNLADGFVIAFVGLFYPWHGVRFLAEAFALVRDHVPSARLLLVGDGAEAPAVRAVLQHHRATDVAHFTGLVSRVDAARYMAAADVLVSPHADVEHFIGSPIKIFEYMAAGRPIVATRVGQIEEVLRHEETALLVPPEDPDAMASALARLNADRALGRKLGSAARADAELNHSWDARLGSILAGRGDASSGNVR